MNIEGRGNHRDMPQRAFVVGLTARLYATVTRR